MVAQVAEEVHYPDGRVGLASPNMPDFTRFGRGQR